MIGLIVFVFIGIVIIDTQERTMETLLLALLGLHTVMAIGCVSKHYLSILLMCDAHGAVYTDIAPFQSTSEFLFLCLFRIPYPAQHVIITITPPQEQH